MPASSQLFDVYNLPAQRNLFLDDWDVVVMPEQTKNLLISYAQTLRRLERVNSSGLGLRRAILLYGPPGCGKTSLARGLPAKWSDLYQVPRSGFIHVNTHALFSGTRGGGQDKVLTTFQQIAEIAGSNVPIFVLVDEVETLGSDRASISMEANPLDALYQVTAFFESLDRCARELPNVTFLFTTNIPKAIDRAVRERVDFVLEIPLPSAEYRSLILSDTIKWMAQAYDVQELMLLARAVPAHPEWMALIDGSAGLSGRALRHVFVVAATLAGDSPTLRLDHLRDALAQVLRAEEGLRLSGGTYLEDYQRPRTALPREPPADVAEDYQADALLSRAAGDTAASMLETVERPHDDVGQIGRTPGPRDGRQQGPGAGGRDRARHGLRGLRKRAQQDEDSIPPDTR